MSDLTLLEDVMEGEVTVSDQEYSETFNSVGSLMEKGELSEAMSQIKTTFQDKVLDIRLITYFFYGCVSREGLKSLSWITPLLNKLIGKQWEKVSPLKKREKHTEKSLIWFFGRHIKSFEGVNRAYLQNNFEPLKKVMEGISQDQIFEIESAMTDLHETLSEKWGKSQACNQLMHLKKSLRELGQLALKLEAEELEEASPPLGIPKTAHKKEVETSSSREEAPRASSSIPQSALQPSRAMEEFYKKMIAFKKLVEEREYEKAAVIAADIEQRLENFNPVAYFPKLFLDYYSLYAKHASSIDDNRDTQASRLLQKLYDADLDTFIDWS